MNTDEDAVFLSVFICVHLRLFLLKKVGSVSPCWCSIEAGGARMATRRLGSVLDFLHRRVTPLADGDTDGELLTRFAARRDEAAFAALMRRHGPMVLGVCRRVLADMHDADDAFQATFLILVRKAGSLSRPELLGHWLYGVAYRTAVRVRAQTAARRRREGSPMHEPPAPPAEDAAWHELRTLLDEELNRLPEKYRRAFVLCDLEGLTNEQAARRLGCPKGTVLSRLSRARELLRHRLNRRGVTVTTTALTALVAENATAAVPVVLFDTTLTSALLFATGPAAAGALSAPAAAIAEGVLKTMYFTKLKIAIALLLLVAAAGSGAGFFVYGPGGSTAPSQEPEKIAQKGETKKVDKAKPLAPSPLQAALEEAIGKNPTEKLIENLRRTVEFGGFNDPKMTLQDALEFLEKNYRLTFDIDERAFGEAGYTDKSVLQEPIAVQPIPRISGVSHATVLRKILSRITTPVGKEATYLLRPDHILITTRDKAWNKIYPGKATGEHIPEHQWNVPIVNVAFDKRPLGEGLIELSALEGLNILIDPRVDEKAKTPVSATLLNVPADAAIRVLADMADLQPAFLDNVIYLTSKENAKRLEQETKKRPQMSTNK
jgi:RNA polymerase sigma factor (sigma-70 family)